MTGTAATAGTTAAAAGYVAMTNAIKASGAIVHVETNDFMDILNRSESPLVVYSPAGIFAKHKYITSYKGLFFYTQSATPLTLSTKIELVQAKKIWIPT